MLKKLFEIFGEIVNLLLEYGWLAALPLGFIYFIFPEFFDTLLGRLIIIIPCVILVVFLIIVFGYAIIGVSLELVFNKYADEYDKLVKNGEDKTKAFAKTSLKAVIGFIGLVLLALLLIFISFSNEKGGL